MWKKAEWIWYNDGDSPDEYGEFTADFSYTGGDVFLSVSADGNLAAWVGETLLPVTQYPDYPWYKTVLRLCVSEWLTPGENSLRFVAWHPGISAFTYFPAPAGLIFEVTDASGRVLAASGAATPARPARGFIPHRAKNITHQLGLSFAYDARDPGAPYTPAVPVNKTATFVPRPILPLTCAAPVPGRLIRRAGNRVLFDLGRETVGYVTLALTATAATGPLTVSYGEHTADGGWVRREIDGRDFSFTYIPAPGENRFYNPLRFLGGRYLQVEGEGLPEDVSLAMIPLLYPLTVRPYTADTPLRQRIYDTAVHTLRCCMHEHYEDCPWREQSLYALDSRNQMLFGYDAFGEYTFPESSLRLMAEGQRDDGFLPICAPAGRDKDRPIPSFSAIYPVAVREWEDRSGRRIDEKIWDTVCRIIASFRAAVDRKTNLLYAFGRPFWNFYEWTDGAANGDEPADAAPRADFLLNALYLLSEEAYAALCRSRGRDPGFDPAPMRAALRQTFRRPDGLYALSTGNSHASELSVALAILSGVAEPEEYPALAEALISGTLTEVSLSMLGFVYDALLQADPERYAPWVLSDLDTKYAKMLDAGATTFWETLKGESDFHFAGSLCHGWSAIPIRYYRLLCPDAPR